MSDFSINDASTTTTSFTLIHSKIFSILGFLLIPILLVCLLSIYFCYKKHYREEKRVFMNETYLDDDVFDVGKPEQTTGL